MEGSGLVPTVERRGLLTRWIIRGAASHERFNLEAADGRDLRVFLERCQLDNIDFSSLEFASFYAGGSSFVHCDFTRTKFLQLGLGQPQVQRSWDRPITPDDPRYPQTVYDECVFSHTRLDPDNTHFGNSRFVRCTFDHAWLRKLFTRTAEFIDCRFVGKVIDCTFHGRITHAETVQRIGRSVNEFRGNDFRQADLIGTAFRGIDLTAQLLPESDLYAVVDAPLRRIELATNQAEADLTGELRDRVVRALALFAKGIGDERQVFIRRGELGWHLPGEIEDLMWVYLTGRPRPHGASQT